jgi:Fe2+ or Zn2+ uptake regulation protein
MCFPVCFIETLGVNMNEIKEEECNHDEHDHGFCLDCGKDITNQLIMAAEANSEGDR